MLLILFPWVYEVLIHLGLTTWSLTVGLSFLGFRSAKYVPQNESIPKRLQRCRKFTGLFHLWYIFRPWKCKIHTVLWNLYSKFFIKFLRIVRMSHSWTLCAGSAPMSLCLSKGFTLTRVILMLHPPELWVGTLCSAAIQDLEGRVRVQSCFLFLGQFLHSLLVDADYKSNSHHRGNSQFSVDFVLAINIKNKKWIHKK